MHSKDKKPKKRSHKEAVCEMKRVTKGKVMRFYVITNDFCRSHLFRRTQGESRQIAKLTKEVLKFQVPTTWEISQQAVWRE